MNPNATLATIRRLAERILNTDTPTTEDWDIAEELSQAITNLDAWIGRGGVLPKDWRR